VWIHPVGPGYPLCLGAMSGRAAHNRRPGEDEPNRAANMEPARGSPDASARNGIGGRHEAGVRNGSRAPAQNVMKKLPEIAPWRLAPFSSA
jgi:hypothetical protein